MWQIIQALTLASSILLGGWLGMESLREVSSDIIAICAVLAAFLIQMMALLATLITPGRLPSDLFEQIVQELDARQTEARVLFISYIGTIVVYLGIKLSKGWTPESSLHYVVSYSVSALAMSMLCYSVVRTVSFLFTLAALQRMRSRLLLQELRIQNIGKPSGTLRTLDDYEPEAHSPAFGRPE